MFDFAGMADAFSSANGGPFHPGTVTYPGTPDVDAGGSIISPGTPIVQDCMVQRDICTEQMRSDADFQERDVRLIITGLDALTTEAAVEILAGPHAGAYALRTATRDPAAFGWECRGRAG
jgi:hypothetical protein